MVFSYNDNKFIIEKRQRRGIVLCFLKREMLRLKASYKNRGIAPRSLMLKGFGLVG